jgi:sugar lactone lactonase YvrE
VEEKTSLVQEQSQDLYDRARGALGKKQYGLAIRLLDELLSMAPEHADAAALRAKGVRKQELDYSYTKARASEAAGDWAVAAREYARIEDDPAFPDAKARRRMCQGQQRIHDLQMNLRQRGATGDWRDVLRISGQLAELDRTAANPDGIATRAQLELLYQEGRRAEDSHDLARAEHLYAEILNKVSDFRDARRRQIACSEAVAHSTAPPRPNRRPGGQCPRISPLLVGAELLRVHHDSAINAVLFNPAGTHLGTGGWDRTARVWDATTGEEVLRVHHDDVVNSVAFSPDGTRLLSCGNDRTARVWDTTTGDELVRLDHSDAVQVVAFGPDGTRFATGCDDGAARVWDAAEGALLLRARHASPVHGVAFHPRGPRLAVAGDDVHLWDIARGVPFLRVRQQVQATGTVFSPDGALLAAGSRDNNAWIWNAESGRRLFKLRHPKAVEAIAFSPDGTRFATGSTDKTARLWNVTTGALVLQLVHGSWVSSVSFSPDSTRLASAGRDGIVRIWHIAGV